MFDATPSFDDGRGRCPDRITVAVPRGFRDDVKRAASAERVSMAEFVRRELHRAWSTTSSHSRRLGFHERMVGCRRGYPSRASEGELVEH
jgi:hypothetical protein